MIRNILPIPQGLPPQNAPSISLVAVSVPSNNNVLLFLIYLCTRLETYKY